MTEKKVIHGVEKYCTYYDNGDYLKIDEETIKFIKKNNLEVILRNDNMENLYCILVTDDLETGENILKTYFEPRRIIEKMV